VFGLSLAHIALIVAIVLLVRQGRWTGLKDGVRGFLKNLRDEKTGVRNAEYRKIDNNESDKNDNNAKKP